MAEIIQRQEFICKLARSFMMFGGPSHRLQAQVLATARVLDVTCSCMYLPDMMLVSFDDVATGTSNIKLVRQGGAFDIYKLQEAYKVYWKVSFRFKFASVPHSYTPPRVPLSLQHSIWIRTLGWGSVEGGQRRC